MKRGIWAALALASATAGPVILAPGTAQAEPGGQPVTACSGWKTEASVFKVDVCVTIDYSSSDVQHYGYVKYFGTGTSKPISFYVYSIVNNSSTACPGGLNGATLKTNQVREVSCYSGQDVGSTFYTEALFTRGGIIPVPILSPKLTDTH